MATGGRHDPRSVNNLLKNGTLVPNRIFVGGISGSTNEDDLRNLFSKFGNVKATKVIADRAGISKGYGFVTFETDYEAQKVLREVERLMLKDRKLNIAPAVKKQPINRPLESSSVQNAIVWPMQSYSSRPSEVSRESVYYPQTSWPVMWPQFYLQQQCQYPSTSQAGFPQYVYPVPPMEYPYQPVTSATGSDYSETSSADSGESVKNRPKPTPLSDYDAIRSVQTKSTESQPQTAMKNTTTTASAENLSTYAQATPLPHMHFPVFAKTLNGVTLMAYPSSFVMGSPVVHINDGTESDNVLSELGVLHSPLAPGSLTPPPTPLASVPRDFTPSSGMDILRKK